MFFLCRPSQVHPHRLVPVAHASKLTVGQNSQPAEAHLDGRIEVTHNICVCRVVRLHEAVELQQAVVALAAICDKGLCMTSVDWRLSSMTKTKSRT